MSSIHNKSKISILGSGWLGLPLAKHLTQLGYDINVSTRSHLKAKTLQQDQLNTYLVDIDSLDEKIIPFLNAETLIINITSKNRDAFANLITQIESSPIEHVLFISSTSVYKNLQRVVTEDEDAENPESALFQIEETFRNNSSFSTTIIRMSGLIGPLRHPGRFFKQGKKVQHADAPVNLIHLDDCLGILSEVILQNCWGQTFNACADTHPTKRVFYAAAAIQANETIPLFSTIDEASFKIVSNEKVKHQLNYQFTYSDLMKIHF